MAIDWDKGAAGMHNTSYCNLEQMYRISKDGIPWKLCFNWNLGNTKGQSSVLI